jgi:hypothetical protein
MWSAIKLNIINVMTGYNGGEGGIRTRDTLLEYTHFPGERLRPLGHLSANVSVLSGAGLKGKGPVC